MPVRQISLDPADKVLALSRVPFFDGCHRGELERVATSALVLTYEDGDVIVPEGEDGLGFYIVLSGGVTVLRSGETIASLGPGQFFGEISLIERGPRTATVVATGNTTCLGILRSFFRPMLVRNPRVALRILETELDRLGTPPDPR